MYTGIVARLDSGVVATRREIGTRYSVNIGCLPAYTVAPIAYVSDLRGGLTVKRFTKYCANYSTFVRIAGKVGPIVEADLSLVLESLLAKPISVLDLTTHQGQALGSIGIDTLGKALKSSEAD